MKRKNRIGLTAILFAFVFMLAGCKGEGTADGEEYEQVVEDYAKILLSMDGDSAEYDNALTGVEAYLERPDSKNLADTREKLHSTISRMEEEQEALVPYTMGESFSGLLKKYAIEPEEYMANADARGMNLAGYVSDLKILDQYLELEEINDTRRGDLEFLSRNMHRQQDLMREYSYCEINYWFAGMDEDAADYVKQQILDQLISYKADTPVWDYDQDAVVRRMEAYLDRWEEVAEELAGYVGEAQEELYEVQ